MRSKLFEKNLAMCRMENTAVGRVSDDFYPTDAASWTSHLGICAYNSLFMAPLVQVRTFCSCTNMQPCSWCVLRCNNTSALAVNVIACQCMTALCTNVCL